MVVYDGYGGYSCSQRVQWSLREVAGYLYTRMVDLLVIEEEWSSNTQHSGLQGCKGVIKYTAHRSTRL